MERIEAPSKTKNSGNDVSVAKRKVAKRDTTCAAPVAPNPIMPPALILPPALTQPVTQALNIQTAVVAMEEEKTEAAVPPTMETVMSMLMQISSHVSQLSEQVNSLTARMDNVEAKCSQLSVRVMTLDAKIKHHKVAKVKSSRVALQVRPRQVGSARSSTAQKSRK
ncbi:hypothetical protein HPB48_005632 [Haemaphysalis longicornis]|uniref:Uncharacterized protein n=1 Tax=Haemaphysalis longicornis TaxID=44386 RepID=A0A9J6G6U5_HAELO|nr:hypothetical protein HPB48_005632 [Haemaphysalis longicornis]